MRHFRILFLAALAYFPISGIAQNEQQNRDQSNPVVAFFLVEGIAAGNAFLASKSPRGMGALQAVLFPVGAIVSYDNPKANPAEPWLILIGGGALAAYNLTVDTSKTSQGQIFNTNFLAVNALVGVGLAITYFSGKTEKNKRMSFGYAPRPHGGSLFVSYRF